MGKLVLVCIGGAVGSGLRFAVASWASERFGPALPIGTLLANLGGSFLIALVAGLSLRPGPTSPNLRLFLMAGVMGGFTTYSSFNLETLRLLEEGAVARAALYVGATVVGCLLAGGLGIVAARAVARLRAAEPAAPTASRR